MKKTIVLCVTWLVVAVAPALAAGPRIQQVTSPQGITAWLVEDHKLPLISMSFAFRGGVECDPADKQGLATLTAALLTQGAGPYDASAFQDILARKSIALSFDAGRDAIEGSLKTLRKNSAEAFRLTSLALTQPRFAPQDFERLRDQQKTAQRFQTASPDWQARYALYSHIFAGHPYSYRSYGSAQTLAAIQREDVVTFAHQRLTRDALMVVVVGSIDARALGLALDQMFDGLPARAQPDGIPPAPQTQLAQTIQVQREGTQTSIAFAAPMITRQDPEWYAAEVANYILGGGGFESRLMKAVRADKGLTYGIGTGLAPMDKASVIAGAFAVNNDKAAQALALLKTEWARLFQEGPSEAEVEAAKAYLIGSWPLGLTSTDAIASNLLEVMQKGLGPNYLEQRNSFIQTIDTKAVKDVLTRAFDPKDLSFAVVGAATGLHPDTIAQEAKD